MVKGLGQSQKFGFGMKFYVGSADDLPLSERVMPGLVAVAWAEAQVLARKWQQKKDSEQPEDWIRCSNNCAPAVGCLAAFPNGGFCKLQLLLAS